MNKRKKQIEEMKKKFEKLSEANKIRYNLGRIMSLQLRTMLFTVLLGFIIVASLLFLPFVIIYGLKSIIIIMAGLGSLIMIGTLILFFFGEFELQKFDKLLEKWMNGKNKLKK